MAAKKTTESEAKAQAPETVRTDYTEAELSGSVPPREAREGYVWTKLFKDSGKYSADVFVGVNGKGYQLKRGMWLEVPESVYKVLENSQAQDIQTAALIEAKSKEFEAESIARGI